MIDQLLKQLEQITKDFLDHSVDLEFEEVERFVGERQELVDKIVAEGASIALNSNQKKALAEILKEDKPILSRMYQLRDDASDWLERNNQIKRQQIAYQNNYAADSYFFDKKN
ncbi:hypothetical protein V3851_19830 [Paenibacillus sp. M1]|uniref:Flagellar protein FliT n=1 Tax=Paenibacillus haidiansis TaxID=1574488 RepID=A0ABU7VYU9_9BACL